MKRYLISCLLLSLCFFLLQTMQIKAQERIQEITLDEAIQLLLTNNLELQENKLEIEKARGHRTTASLWSNPTFSFYREDLSTGSLDYAEVIFGLDYQFDLSGQRGLRKRAAQFALSAAGSQFDHEQNMMIFEVKRVYLMTVFAKKRLVLLKQTAEVFKKAALTGTDRFEEGDISGFDHIRLRVERTRYQSELAYAQIEYDNVKRELGVLIGPPDVTVEYEPREGLTYLPLHLTLEQLLNKARQHRPDLKRIEHLLRSSRETLRLTKRERYPLFNLSAGYKRQRDDFKGPVFGVNLSLPLFDRNQGRVTTNRAELLQQQRRRTYLEKQTEMEVVNAFTKVQRLDSQLKRLDEELLLDAEQILEIAQFSYKEGHMSLLELLDAARSHYESQLAYYQLLSNYRLALFELEKATGTTLEN
ncbi:MAG: TolC family protein [bacterium]